MDFKCGYRGYSIVRKAGDLFWQIYNNAGELALPDKFYDFASARREVDWLKGA